MPKRAAPIKPLHAVVALSGVALALAAFLVLRAARGGGSGGSEAAPALAALVPHAGGCELTRVRLADGVPSEVVVLPSDCAGAQLAFHPATTEAVAWFQPAESDPRDVALFSIDLERERFRRLPLPLLGDAETFAFDVRGRLLAFTVDSTVELAGTDEAPLVVRGARSFPARPGVEGTHAVAATLHWNGDRWREVEALATRCCTDGVPLGAAALPTYQSVIGAPRLVGLLASPIEARRSPPPLLQDPALRRALPPGEPMAPWVHVTHPTWAFALVAEADGFPARFAKTPLYLEQDRALSPLVLPDGAAPHAPGDLVEIRQRGPYALVVDAVTGMRPLALDMRTGAVAHWDPLAFAARFWPLTPSEHL